MFLKKSKVFKVFTFTLGVVNMESTPSLPTCRALLHEKELLKLKALFDMGLLDDVQLKEGVAEVLAPKPSPQAPSTKKRPREVSLVLGASSSVKSNKRQKSILAFGSYTKLTTTKDGEQILISSVADAQGVPRASTMFECSQCDFTHHLKCSVALHAKIHSEWAKGPRPKGQGLFTFNSTSDCSHYSRSDYFV